MMKRPIWQLWLALKLIKSFAIILFQGYELKQQIQRRGIEPRIAVMLMFNRLDKDKTRL